MFAGCRSRNDAGARGAGSRRLRGVRAMRLGGLVIALMAVAAPAASAATSPSQQWMTSAGPGITAAGETMNVAFGTTGVTGVLTGVSNTCNGSPGPPPSPPSACWARPFPAGFDAYTGVGPYIEPDHPAGMTVIAQGICCSGAAGPYGQTTVHTWAFNKPVIAPIVHVVNLGASYLDITGTTTAGAPITLSALSKNNALDIAGNRLNGATQNDSVNECSLDGSPSPISTSACGSIQLGGGLVQGFTMTDVLGVNNFAGDGWTWAVSFPTAPLTKQFSPNRIPVGGTSQLTFSIANPANPTQPALSPLDFTDTLPANVTLANGTVSNNGSCGSPSVADSGGGALGAGDGGVKASNISVAVGATCTITVNVTSSTVGNYVNDNNNLSTSVANLVPNASTPLEVYPLADLEIVKSADPAPIVPGKNVTYSLKVSNKGPNTATNVKVTDQLPSGLSFVSAGSGCTQASKTVTCTLASLAKGASHTFTFVAKAASSAKSCSELSNTATVTNDVVDPDQSNNSSTFCEFERLSNLALTKTPSSASVASGGQVMYTLVVKNNGPSDADGVKVSDPMASGLSLVSAKPSQGSCSTAAGKVACDMGDLAVGGSAQVLVTANVTAPAGSCGASAITNTGTVSSENRDPDPSDNKASASICTDPGPDPTFDLVVAKTAASKSVYVGQPLKYTVTVTNKGPAAAPNAKVTDTLNAPASVSSVKATQGSCTKTIPMTCQLGNVPAGGKVTITITVKLRDSGCKQRNAASATGDGTDANPANNLAKVDVCAKAVPLRLTKIADSASVRAGSTVGYTIRVSNPTVGEAKDVKVCDKLPSGLVYVSSKARAKFTSGQYCWTIKTLGAHQSQSFRITVRALGSASGDRVNRATASAKGAKTKRAKDPVHVLARRAVLDRPTG
jgi:uncharacterized repeat protein (TIGR01451 family)